MNSRNRFENAEERENTWDLRGFEVDVLNSGGSAPCSDGLWSLFGRRLHRFSMPSKRLGAELHNDPSLMPIVQSYMNALEFQFNMPANSSCADYLPYCDQPDSRLLRLACGHTCGPFGTLKTATERPEAVQIRCRSLGTSSRSLAAPPLAWPIGVLRQRS